MDGVFYLDNHEDLSSDLAAVKAWAWVVELE
jgi:hypothetical protein